MLTARRNKGWRILTALRPVMAMLLIALMAGNAVAGSFSGFLHSHALEDSGHHHHDDSSDHHHHNDAGGALPVVDVDGVSVSATDGSLDQGQLHEHGPIMALGLTSALGFAIPGLRPTWASPRPDSLVLDRRIASERPPRAA